MKALLMASISLAFAASASAQQPQNISHLTSRQSGNFSSASASPDAQMAQASLYMVHKQYEEAAAIYQQMLKTSPHDPGLWNRLGIAYHQQSMLGPALKCYEKASKYDKTSGRLLEQHRHRLLPAEEISQSHPRLPQGARSRCQ